MAKIAFIGLGNKGFGTDWEVLDAADTLCNLPGGYSAHLERFLDQ